MKNSIDNLSKVNWNLWEEAPDCTNKTIKLEIYAELLKVFPELTVEYLLSEIAKGEAWSGCIKVKNLLNERRAAMGFNPGVARDQCAICPLASVERPWTCKIRYFHNTTDNFPALAGGTPENALPELAKGILLKDLLHEI